MFFERKAGCEQREHFSVYILHREASRREGIKATRGKKQLYVIVS